jgi:hypothetical protein
MAENIIAYFTSQCLVAGQVHNSLKLLVELKRCYTGHSIEKLYFKSNTITFYLKDFKEHIFLFFLTV